MQKVLNGAIGLIGAGSVELVSSSQLPGTDKAEMIVKIIVQIAIGVFTIIGLFKRPNKSEKGL